MMTLSASILTRSAIGVPWLGYRMDQPVVSAVAVISYVTSTESFAAFVAVIVQCPAKSARRSGERASFLQAPSASAATVKNDQRIGAFLGKSWLALGGTPGAKIVSGDAQARRQRRNRTLPRTT